MVDEGDRPSLSVRAMRPDDLIAADRILRASFGDFSHAGRIDALLRQRGARSLLAECEGGPAGVAFGNDYVTCGYVSLMGVAPEFRRRGVASRLMAELIAWSEARAHAGLRLDATEAGAAVYRGIGFVDAGETVVLRRAAAPADVRAGSGVREARAPDGDAIRALDAGALGADRSALLEMLLAERTVLLASGGRGYAVLNAAENGAVVGPWIAADREAARELLAAAVARLRAAAEIKLFVPANNAVGLELAREAGFEAQRDLRHMIRGRAEAPRATLFGRANLGQG